MASKDIGNPLQGRVGDIGPLPKRMLAPIEGYESTPLVCIEKAIEPVISLVPKIERNVRLVKENCTQPSDGLSIDESASIMLYTYESTPREDSLYMILNATLRSEQRKELKIWFPYLKLILTALAKLPPRPCDAFRGVREDLSADYPLGKQFIWWGFSSCTARRDVLEYEEFCGNSGQRTRFEIRCHTGVDIRKHSFIPQEEEILLLPARKLKVCKCVDYADGLHVIYLQEIDHPDYLLAPITDASNIGTKPLSVERKRRENRLEHMLRASQQSQWAKRAMTVVGGKGKGRASDQLNWARGLTFDNRDNTIFIADYENDRIIAWEEGATEGKIIICQYKDGHELCKLNRPKDVVVDNKNQLLYICDNGNRRVVQCSIRNGPEHTKVIIDNIKCCGLAIDTDGNIYVSDEEKHDVKRYERGEMMSNGKVVAGGNGPGDRLNQLNTPTFIFVDKQYSVYVSDFENHRVMKWRKDAKQGEVVAGGHGKGKALTQLTYPQGIMVDTQGTVYVAEWGNDRVTRWLQPNACEIIAGGEGTGRGFDQLSNPAGLSFDDNGNLYVVDSMNARVQCFRRTIE